MAAFDAALDPAYEEWGTPATYTPPGDGAPAVPCVAMVDLRDDREPGFATAQRHIGPMARLRCAEIAAPVMDGVLAFAADVAPAAVAGKAYRIATKPESDRVGGEWSLKLKLLA